MNEEERRKESHALHQESKRYTYKKDTGLCWVILGLIALVIGLVFIILSFKMERNVFVGIDFTSVAFVICCIMLGLGLILLIGGIIMAVTSQKKVNAIRKELNMRLGE